MAENKKSFILYADIIHTVEQMPPDKAGELFLTILEYVNDRNPTPNDILIKVAFEPIKRQLKRDLKAWEEAKQAMSEGGKAGAKKRWGSHRVAKEPNGVSKGKMPVNVNVTVNDNVSSKEDNKTTYTKSEIQSILSDLISDREWIESIQYSFHMGKDESVIKGMMSNFALHLKTESKEKHVTIDDFKRHFKYWLQDKRQREAITELRKSVTA